MKVRSLLSGGVIALLALSSLLSLFACGGKSAFNLADAGKTGYAIVLTSEASPSEEHAAQELSMFLTNASGADFPVVRDTEPRAQEPIRLFVGFGPESEKAVAKGKAVDHAKLGEEGFIIRTIPNEGASPDVILAGARQRGTMYAVYSFLDAIGFRWYTNRTTWYPKDKNLPVLTMDEEVNPYFMYREPYIYEGFNPDWAARNRVNLGHSFSLDEAHGGSVVTMGGHSFGQMIPNSLFKEHPDYFPLIGGTRVTGYVQRCLSNPGVVEVAAKNMIKWMDENPNAKIFSLAQEDTEKLCECEECVRKTEEEGAPSGLYLDFVNKVAEIVEKTNPDRYIITFAYWFTEKPPKTVKPRDNVIIRLCPISICVAHPFMECQEKPSVEFRDHLKGWAQLSNFTFIWHYNTNFTNLMMPFPNFKEFTADIEQYYENGVKGIFFQGSSFGPGGAESDLRAWVMARMLWDPYQDPDAVVNEYLAGVFGKAAKPMRAYYDLIHAQVAAPDKHLHIFEMVSRDKYPNDVLAEMDKLHEEALTLAEGDTTATYYVKKSRMSVMYTQYTLNTGLLKVSEGEYKPEGNTVTTADYDRFIDYTKQFDVVQLNEKSSDSEFIKMLRQRTETFKTVSIENPDLKITLVPDLGGRMVSILHKKSGKELLNNLGTLESYYPNIGGYEETTTRSWGCSGFANSYSVKASARSISLASTNAGIYYGRTPSGLVFERTITLPPKGAKINISSAITNKGKSTEMYQLVCRMHLNAEPQSVRLLAKNASGEMAPAMPTEADGTFPIGSFRYDGVNKPAGSWKIEGVADGLSLVNTFDANQLETCILGTSERSKSARMELQTPVKDVPAGGKIAIQHTWEIVE